MIDDLLEANHLEDEDEANLSSQLCHGIMFQPNILEGFDTTDFIARDYEWHMSFNLWPGSKSI